MLYLSIVAMIKKSAQQIMNWQAKVFIINQYMID